MTVPTPPTYEGQLAQRAAELLPGVALAERLELLDAMDPDDMRTSLAFIATMYPQTFDHALVRDRKLVEQLQDRLDHAHDDDPEPWCTACGAKAGIFLNHGPDWKHYRGEGTVACPVELFNAGHAPVIAWREAARSGFEPVPRLQRACLVCGVNPVAVLEGDVCADCDQTGTDPAGQR